MEERVLQRMWMDAEKDKECLRTGNWWWIPTKKMSSEVLDDYLYISPIFTSILFFIGLISFCFDMEIIYKQWVYCNFPFQRDRLLSVHIS